MTLEVQEAERRRLVSTVKRLKSAATPGQLPGEELADALVALVAVRLLAWEFAEAATVAPESVVSSARVLAAKGPAGPYTSLADAMRFFCATAQLAAVQAALGQAEPAGSTLDGLDLWREQVAHLPLARKVPPSAVIWAQIARARSMLQTDPASANAWADAAQRRLHALEAPPDYLAIATHLLTADCRWAAGRPDSALTHHWLAISGHNEILTGTRRPRPGVVKLALAPVPAIYESCAARLAAIGDLSGGIALRRAEIALLESYSGSGTAAEARAGLAAALAEAGREQEAAAELAAITGPPVPAATRAPAPGPVLDWPDLPLAVSLNDGVASAGQARWRAAEHAGGLAAAAARAEAERDEAGRRAQADAESVRRAEAQHQAEQAASARLAADEAEAAAQAQLRAERAANRALEEAAQARTAADERRRQLAREHRPMLDPDTARVAAAELDHARQAVSAAGEDLVPLAAAQERLADTLRPLAAMDPSMRGEFAGVLEALVGLRWRLGDPEGSRAAAREAKMVRS